MAGASPRAVRFSLSRIEARRIGLGGQTNDLTPRRGHFDGRRLLYELRRRCPNAACLLSQHVAADQMWRAAITTGSPNNILVSGLM